VSNTFNSKEFSNEFNNNNKKVSSHELAQYIEATDGIAKPWLLAQLRLAKLQESKPNLSSTEYETTLASIHADLMTLGEWWRGNEEEIFG
jgi:hypothetical protein